MTIETKDYGRNGQSVRLEHFGFGMSMHVGSDETGWEWASAHFHDPDGRAVCRPLGVRGVAVELVDNDRGAITLYLPPSVVTAIENRRDTR